MAVRCDVCAHRRPAGTKRPTDPVRIWISCKDAAETGSDERPPLLVCSVFQKQQWDVFMLRSSTGL